MVEDPSLFSSLEFALENTIFLADDFALDITGHGGVICQHGWIVDVFHVPSVSANLLSFSQLT